MSDLTLTDDGDLTIDASGDLSLTPDSFHNYSQQAYIRAMTDMGDFGVYPRLGASLERLMGMPNTERTGDLGCNMIKDALARESVFSSLNYDVLAVPIAPHMIRFDIYITVGSRTELILSVNQELTQISLGTGD